MRDVRVTVAELNDEQADPRRMRRSGAEQGARPQANRLGLVLSELTAQQRRELRTEGGLRVEDVTGGVRSDLRVGDVILAVIARGSQTTVATLDQFNGILSSLEPKVGLTVLVRRGESQTFLTLRSPAEAGSGK
jgi:serine protease Do